MIAKQEYKNVSTKIKTLKNDLTDSQDLLVETIMGLDKSDINDKETYSSITEVNNKTSELLKNGFMKIEDSFLKKSENLSDFTVTLFGRTKAGKSTIREALNHGDGSTIGKGSQRTTRDVKIYNWNYLRILDTPGLEAYRGEEDEKIAFSQIDETDLILFLVVSDSIEESEFEKLASIRRENKPVIILLNVKHDLKHPVKRKQLLNSPMKYVSEDAISGHLNRLKFLSKKHFDIQNITVIPIHALAAFESINSRGSEKTNLYKVSNFKYFSDYLINEVEITGRQRRVQSFRDSYISHLEKNIKPVYKDSGSSLIKIVRVLRGKQIELKHWFEKFIKNKNDEIEREVEKMFVSLFNQLDSFIDQNIESSNFNTEWNKRVNEHITNEKIKSIQDNILSDMNQYLEEFFKEFKFDLNLSAYKIEPEKIGEIKKGSTGRILRWSSAAAAVILTAVPNSWNPLGWGLAIVGLGIAIFSLFFGDDTKQFNTQKANLKIKITNKLEKMQRKNTSALKSWFYKDITRGLKKKITHDLYYQVKNFDKLMNEYFKIVKKIDSIIGEENIELIKRLLKLQNSKNYNLDVILKVARIQGLLSKILVDKPLFNDDKSRKDFMHVYGEKVIEVKNSDDRIKLLLNSLTNNLSEIINANYSSKEKKFIVKVKESIAGKILGVHGANVRTSENIINDKIEIKGV